jgi:hypothetical protein
MAADKEFRKLEDLSPEERAELRVKVERLKSTGRMGSRDDPPASARDHKDPLPLQKKQ